MTESVIPSRTCSLCGEAKPESEYYATQKGRWCKSCRSERARLNRISKKPPPFSCPICGQQVANPIRGQMYCGRACKDEAYRRARPARLCERCGVALGRGHGARKLCSDCKPQAAIEASRRHCRTCGRVLPAGQKKYCADRCIASSEDDQGDGIQCGRCKVVKSAQDFHPSQQANGKWCKACLRSSYRARVGGPPVPRDCERCGTRIEQPVHHQQRFCSKRCSQQARLERLNPRVERFCEWCSEPVDGSRRRFCGRLCASRARSARTTPEAKRQGRLLAKYGLTLPEYAAMVAEQGDRCAICGSSDNASWHEFWAVDHCHATGRVRALLCAPCNAGLGNFKDNPSALRAAADYVERFQRE